MSDMPSADIERGIEFVHKLYEHYYFLLYRYALPKMDFDEDAAANCAHAVFDVATKNIDK